MRTQSCDLNPKKNKSILACYGSERMERSGGQKKIPQYVIALLLILGSLVNFVECLHPVIFVPGDGGSQIDAKLDKPSVVHYLCDKKTTDYYNIWLNLELLVPVIIDCWVDNVRLIYNFTTRTTHNSPGVDIRVPNFGDSFPVEFLDPTKASQGVYFNSIVENSLIPLGYTRNVSIKGAPYDFRKAPNEMSGWLKDFKTLVEDTFESNGQNSVIFICHSMGSPLSQYFLSLQTKEWKDKYVRAIFTVGGVWGGSVKALKVFAVGDDLGTYVLSGPKLRGYQMTAPSTAWLLPPKKFWGSDEILVTVSGKRNYTVNDLGQFFLDMNYPEGKAMLEDTQNLLGDYSAPEVEIHCLHGAGVSTPEAMNYKDVSHFPTKPTVLYGNGDGTVNIRSLRGCLRWANSEDDHWKLFNKNSRLMKSHSAKFKKKWKLKMQNSVMAKGNTAKIYHEEYPGVDHMQILSDSRVITYIKDVVGQMNKKLKT